MVWMGLSFLKSALKSLEHERCYTHVTPSSVKAEHWDKELKANQDIPIFTFHYQVMLNISCTVPPSKLLMQSN